MGQFAIETKAWIKSAMRQRRFLLKNDKSHRDRVKTEMALERLELQFKLYSFENDIYMARFVRNFSDDIEAILPGSGSKAYITKHSELNDINNRAIQLIAGNIRFKQLQNSY